MTTKPVNQRKVLATAVDWSVTVSPEKRTPYVQVLFVLRPETRGNEPARIVWKGFLTDDTAERTVASLRHMGWSGRDLRELQGLERNEVELVLEDEEYEGKLYTKVAFVNRAQMLAPVHGEALAQIAERFKGVCEAVDERGAFAGANR